MPVGIEELLTRHGHTAGVIADNPLATIMKHTVEKKPGDAWGLTVLAQVYLSAHQYRLAYTNFHRAIEASPKTAEPWLGIARIYYDLILVDMIARNQTEFSSQGALLFLTDARAEGHLVECRRLFTAAKNLPPLRRSETHDPSTRIFAPGMADQFVEMIESKLLFYYNKMGNEADNRGQAQVAIEHYDKALKINSHYDPAVYNKGMVLSRMGQFTKAYGLLDTAVSQKPKRAKYLMNRSIAKLRMQGLSWPSADENVVRVLMQELRSRKQADRLGAVALLIMVDPLYWLDVNRNHPTTWRAFTELDRSK